MHNHPHGRGGRRFGRPDGLTRENRPHHGGRRRRLFEGAELRLILLALVAEAPRHGYDLIREIEERTGGAYAPSPGVVYPTLTLLADMGFLAEEAAAGPRRLLAITEEGRAHLAAEGDALAQAMGRLKGLAEVAARTDAAPVRRAMENLKMALRNRLLAAETTRETVLEVAAILDEAASRIERL